MEGGKKVSLLPNSAELTLIASQVEEAVNLYGVSAFRYRANEVSMYDDAVELNNQEQVQILFLDNPERRLLDTLGWWVKDERPFLVYLPFTMNGKPTNPQRNDVLVMPDRSAYRVQEINRTLLNGVWYVLKCNAYVRDVQDSTKSPEGTESTFLKQPRREVY